MSDFIFLFPKNKLCVKSADLSVYTHPDQNGSAATEQSPTEAEHERKTRLALCLQSYK